mgnify:CR=1 FL=1
MRKNMCVLLAIMFLLAVMVVPAAAITWGEPDTEHINVGAMVIYHPDHQKDWQTCSGTLVNPEIFLTAGHCTARLEELIEAGDLDLNQIWVNFNQDALNEETKLDVEQVITHPDYNISDPSNPYDVGVLILTNPVTDIEPANLPDEGFLDILKQDGLLHEKGEGAIFTVVGYGGQLDEWPPPDIEYYGKRQFAESEYLVLRPVWLHLSQNLNRDNGGTCFGDSGGPAFWSHDDGTEILVGITSWGDAQCVASGFYYRVDIPETLGFIDGLIPDPE